MADYSIPHLYLDKANDKRLKEVADLAALDKEKPVPPKEGRRFAVKRFRP